MASMFGGIGSPNQTHNGCPTTHSFSQHPSNHHKTRGILPHSRGTELTILETALVYGFRHLADDDSRLRLLGMLEQDTASLIAKAQNTTDR